MAMVNANGTSESLDFAQVNFNGDAAEESSSLQDYKKPISESYTLAVTNLTFDKKILIFTGELSSRRRLRNLALTEGETIQMTLVDNSNEGNKYDCTINDVSSSPSTLKCDTSDIPLRTTGEKLNLNAGTDTSNSTLFTVKMTDDLLNQTVSTPSKTKYNYQKNSSGLNGGAIAGIIVGCVVALLAATIAAIILRKPASSPTDNSTIVDLKTGAL
jgi:hypothetical protein